MNEINTDSEASKELHIFSVYAKSIEEPGLDGLVVKGNAPPDIVIAACHLVIKMVQGIPWNKEKNRINIRPPAMEKGEYIPHCPKCNRDHVVTHCRQYSDRPGVVDVGWKCSDRGTEYGFEG